MTSKPNFIIIHCDQLRYDCVNASGRKQGIYTPYIDSIANQGANFSSCYSTCPVCIPQRLSLMSGQYPKNHGVFYNVGVPNFPFEATLPQEMSKGGYLTALVGRTLHTYPFTEPYGFEYYLPGDPSSSLDDSGDPTDAFFKYVREHSNPDDGGYNGNGAFNNSRVAVPFHLSDDCHHTKWTTNRAIEFLKNRDKSRPFMLFVGYYAPHSPHNPPKEYFDRYYLKNEFDKPFIADYDVPPVSNGHHISSYVNLSEEDRRAMLAGYYGNVSFVDAQVGRILSLLTFIPNTYVIFTSDHGDMLGDHYMYQKTRAYESSSHVPFMISGPGIGDSQTIDTPISWEDIMPTVLDIANLPIPSSVDGKSLKEVLFNNPHAYVRDYIHGETVQKLHGQDFAKAPVCSNKKNLFFEEGTQYLTDGKFKYIWHITSGTEQLFDVEHDFKELYDLSGDPKYENELLKWRQRLIKELSSRDEGFSDGEKLIAGKKPQPFTNKIKHAIDERIAQGKDIEYYFYQRFMKRK